MNTLTTFASGMSDSELIAESLAGDVLVFITKPKGFEPTSTS